MWTSHAVVAAAVALAAALCSVCTAAPTPIIFDTDIGTDFDDSAAIALALSEPSLDVKLIVTATGDTTARARIVCKYLELVGRTDVAVGIGLPNNNASSNNPLYGWAADYNISSYPGVLYTDGVQAMIDTIKASPSRVTILAIAPATNFPELLAQGGPAVVANAQIVAMSGSIYRGYDNSTTPAAEYNVAVCPGCTQAMYSAGWPVTSTPLDTCGTAQLSGDAYNTLLSSTSPIGTVLVECYLYWCVNGFWNPQKTSDVWYDAVATFLATPAAAANIQFKTLNIAVTSDGYTVISPTGSPVSEALLWTATGEAFFESSTAAAIASGGKGQ